MPAGPPGRAKTRVPAHKKGPGFPGPLDSSFARLKLYYIRSLKPFLALNDIEAYRLSFRQGLESVTLDRGKVNENVRPIFLLDKTETLAVIEPFNHTLCHPCFLLLPFA
jgi:hypothetical protein